MLIVLGAILAVCGVSCGFLISYQLWQLQFEVNERLSPDQKLEPAVWTLSAHEKLRYFQKKLLPQSSRLKRSRQYAIGGWVLLVAGVGLLLSAIN
jgi:hypothetical protein